jgi:hypothetical protein
VPVFKPDLVAHLLKLNVSWNTSQGAEMTRSLVFAGCIALTGLACGGSYSSPKNNDPAAGTVLASSSRVTASAGATQSTTAGTPFATALQGTVTTVNTVSNGDGYGGSHSVTTPVAGVTVTFTIVAGTGGASGTFPGPTTTATAVTDSLGQAVAPTLTANGTTGAFTVTAAATGYTTATFNLTNN